MKNLSKLSYCFFFNGDRGLEILKLFVNKEFKIIRVFLSKKFLRPKILKKIPKKIKVSIIDNLKNNNITNALKSTDVALCCGFPLIFPKSLLKLPKIGFLNCHAGKLPKYRGGSPLNWQLINCEKKFGISVIKLNNKIDAGNICAERNFIIKDNYNINDLHRIANKSFPQMVMTSIKKLNNKEKLKRQSKTIKIWKQRTFMDSKFHFESKSFFEADRFVKALQNPYPNAFIYFNYKKYKIVKIIKTKVKLNPGKILRKSKNLYLGLKDCTVKAKFKFNQ